MKKFLLFVVMFVMSASLAVAQSDIIRFLEIPVDGTKKYMTNMLRVKGFRGTGDLFGQFNGEKVRINIQTNSVRYVWRIAVSDENTRDEVQIKIRFNNLIQQFLDNKKYIHIDGGAIPEDENIKEGIVDKKKMYQAVFGQTYMIDSVGLRQRLSEKFTKEQIANFTKGQLEDELKFILYDLAEKRKVWFMIDYVGFDRYRIVMFYENEYNNSSNGEDL